MQVIQENNIKPFERFVKTIGNSNTQREYVNALRRFMEKYHVTEYGELLKVPTEDLENTIANYIAYLKEKGNSKGYVTSQLAGIKQFFVPNRVKLNWEYIYEFKGEFKKKNKDEAYSHEQIQELLKVTDIRSRCMVLIFSSTGIRLGALPQLKLKHISKIGELYGFTIYDNEENQEYITFCTPECAAAIDNYKRYREQAGEVLTEESYLIRNEFDPNNIKSVRKYRHITDYTITTVLRNYLVKAGIRTVEKGASKSFRHKTKVIHGFRKFYSSQLVNANLNTEKRWLLEGHNLKRTHENCVRVTEELYKEYILAIDNLTIDPANKLKKQVAKLTEETSQIELLEMKMNKRDEGIQMMAQLVNDLASELYKTKEFSNDKRRAFSYKWLEVADKMGFEMKEKEKQCPKCKNVGPNYDVECASCGYGMT